jgi:spore coat polysaccharide biosynthesis protein SpsF
MEIRMTVLAILQARVTSTRLPNKVLAPILGQPMLARQIERLRRATTLDKLVVATSDDASDDPLAAMCATIGVPCYRGSLNDVLARFQGASVAHGPADHIVRLTGDCPLADPAMVDAVVRHHQATGADYTSNAIQPSWPDGLDVEVMRASALQRAFNEACLLSEREHVTPYIHKHPEWFRIQHVKSDIDLSSFRWTVDESADLTFVSEVYAALYPQNPAFDTAAILALLEQRPELAKLNDQFLRNEGYAKSLAADTPNIPSN